MHAGIGVLGGAGEVPGNQGWNQGGAGMQIGAPNKLRFSASVHVLTPSRHEQVLHELLPVSLPDQPLDTVSPPAKVHSFSAGVGVVTMTTGGGKIDVAVAWANRVGTIDGGVALVPSGSGVFLEATSSSVGPIGLVGAGLGELVGDGLGVLVGVAVLFCVAVLVGVTVSGTIQGPALLQLNTPSVHEQVLQKLLPVSFPAQPLRTVSPPDKVHIGTRVAVLVAVLVTVAGTGVSVGGTSVGIGVDVLVGVDVCAAVVKFNVVVSLIPQ